MNDAGVWILLYVVLALGFHCQESVALQQFFSPSTTISSILPKKVGRVTAGPITISELGCGTWSWGNRLLWNYDTSQDQEIYEAYKIVRDAGVTLFDTADSYGTFDLNGRAEILLGQFERRYQSEKAAQPPSFFSAFSKDDSKTVQQVATKFAPYPWRITPSSLVSAARQSLKRLEQEKVAIAQCRYSFVYLFH